MRHVRFIEKNNDKINFSTILRKRVDYYFKENGCSQHYNTHMIMKTIIMLSAYIIPFICILFLDLSNTFMLILWAVMGIALAGVGMSIMHDANHGSYSESKTVNYWMGHTLNLLGVSVFNWKLQHNILHHTYTNIVHLDDDIDDKFILRFSPHTQVKWYHRFQYLYAFLFYGILTIYWVFVKDFIQFKKYKQKGLHNTTKKQRRVILIKILVVKMIYASIFLLIPILVFRHSALLWIMGFMLMHFIAGILLTVVFQLAHTVEHTTHPKPDQFGTIENSWAIHQLNTTVNFSRNNKLISWYVGGLNFQIEHHLFPGICHVHYPAISPIVKEVAAEFGITYLENESIFKAIKSHVRLLKHFGKELGN